MGLGRRGEGTARITYINWKQYAKSETGDVE